MKKPTWKTKDGRTILISEMSDSHLINTVKYLQRSAPALRDNIVAEAMMGRAGLQGDMACYYADVEFDKLMEQDPQEILKGQPQYKAMIQELKKRKIAIPKQA